MPITWLRFLPRVVVSLNRCPVIGRPCSSQMSILWSTAWKILLVHPPFAVHPEDLQNYTEKHYAPLAKLFLGSNLYIHYWFFFMSIYLMEIVRVFFYEKTWLQLVFPFLTLVGCSQGVFTLGLLLSLGLAQFIYSSWLLRFCMILDDQCSSLNISAV